MDPKKTDETKSVYEDLQERVKKQFELQAKKEKKREENRKQREGSNIYYPVIKENEAKQHFAQLLDGTVYLITNAGWKRLTKKKKQIVLKDDPVFK